MAERNLSVDHVTIWRWVQPYAPELNRALPPGLQNTNRTRRVHETYCRVAGKWAYLYRAVDSNGATIDFLLSATRDADSAKRFLQKSSAFARVIPGRGSSTWTETRPIRRQ